MQNVTLKPDSAEALHSQNTKPHVSLTGKKEGFQLRYCMIGQVWLLTKFIRSHQGSKRKERGLLITYSLSEVLSQHVLVLDTHLFIYLT